ncbi:MAG: helix-hairpin-helix domain-containing protein [Ruminococcus flavefaciens]|nr:helix-hairpin-helix domain-containing protein [Ruminococcus flavefaciens]MCM1059544.1 helix-hairpin-helix domain-containing protein [Eubacterium sp.]
MNKKEPFALLLAGIIIISTAVAMAIKENDIKHEIRVIENSSHSEVYMTDAIQETEIPEVSATTVVSETQTVSATTVSVESTAAENDKIYININTAGADELVKLKGIGPVLSEAIIDYRLKNGNFNNIEEIMLVSGIGEGIFENIKNYIYVENPDYTAYPAPESEPESDIYIDPEPEPETEEEVTDSYQVSLEDVAPININTADTEELKLLPYVTDEIAERIIWLREAIGGYSHVYELLYIEELEQSEVAEIVDYVTVG